MGTNFRFQSPVPRARVLRLQSRRVIWLCAVVVVVCGGTAWVFHGTTSDALVEPMTVVLQYQPVRKAASVPVYAGLLEHTGDDMRFLVAVSSDEHEADLRESLGSTLGRDPRLAFLRVEEPLGPWVRDRYIPFRKNGRRHLYVPPTGSVPAPERGCLEVARELLRRDPKLVRVGGRLALEGGDVILTSRDVLVGVHTAGKHTRGNPALRPRFEKQLRALFGRQPLIVGNGRVPLPYDHIDMFLSAADDGTLLLGDPGLAVETLAGGGAPRAVLHEGEVGRFLLATQRAQQRRYERVADQLSERGFRIIRVPILHGEPMSDGRRGALMTWNNALLDRAGRRAFVPRYEVPALDERAYGIWRSVGYEVVPIDVRAAIVRGGAIRCLTTVLESREPARRRSRPD